MKIIDFDKLSVKDKSVITFGNFDGLHLGHDKLITNLLEIANTNNLKSLLLTFNPHTRSVVKKDEDNFIITPHKLKLELLKEYSLDYISVIQFNKKFSEIKPFHFIDTIIASCNPAIVLIGYDNRFGSKGEGNYEILKKYLSEKNIKVIKFQEYYFNDISIKSTLVKKLIKKGEIERASSYLGRSFSLCGSVVEGKGRGKELGFPTANLKLTDKEQIIPKVGLYYVNFVDGHESYKALCNIGYRPTFDDDEILSIESYIIKDGNFDFYHKEIRVEFLKYLRDEIKFSSKEELINQIKNDIISVEKVTD